MQTASRQIVGPRPDQQDSIVVTPFRRSRRLLAGVFDGVGGQPNGAACSSQAAALVRQGTNPSRLGALLNDAHAECRHLGGATTATVGLFDETVNSLHIFHVGDSRAYLFDTRGLKPRLCQLTRDDAGLQPCTLTHALGFEPLAWHEIRSTYTPGDLYLFATDGLTNSVNHADLEDLFRSWADVGHLADAIRRAVLAVGPVDNVSYVLVRT